MEAAKGCDGRQAGVKEGSGLIEVFAADATEWSGGMRPTASVEPRVDSTRTAYRGQGPPAEETTLYRHRWLSGGERCGGLAFCGHLPLRRLDGTACSGHDRRSLRRPQSQSGSQTDWFGRVPWRERGPTVNLKRRRGSTSHIGRDKSFQNSGGSSRASR
jgi:hypothetical protein